MSDDIAISVNNVSKTFKLPYEKHSTLKGVIVNFHRNKKGYKKQVALKDISFEIKKGEFFGIVGRNGSGKSTLLKLISGIYTPDSGTIQVNGKLTPFIELGVGFNPELTGKDNVYLNGALLGFNHKEVEAMYDEIVAFAELEKFMEQKLKNYSSGMQVRLAFSIAIRANTDILVLDEVLAVGDANFQKKCFSYFEKLKRNDTTVILVSHDMSSVVNFCDKALLIEGGKIVANGRTQKISDLYMKSNVENTNNIDKYKKNKNYKIANVYITEKNKNVRVSELEPHKDYTIHVKIDIGKNDKNIGVGFAVKTISGVSILGYNSYFDSNKEKNTFSSKGIHTIKYSFNNILKNGGYRINVGIHRDIADEKNGTYYLDPIYVEDNAYEFVSVGWNPPGSVVEPSAEITINS